MEFSELVYSLLDHLKCTLKIESTLNVKKGQVIMEMENWKIEIKINNSITNKN